MKSVNSHAYIYIHVSVSLMYLHIIVNRERTNKEGCKYRIIINGVHVNANTYPITVKSLIEARAFIRIITFSGEGGGRLLEAVVLANYV